MKKLQSYKKYGNQVRIDNKWWQILVHLKADLGLSVKALVEDALSRTYSVNNDGSPYRYDETITRSTK